MTAFVGARLTDTFTAAAMTQGGKGFGLGDRYVRGDGTEYVFVQANGAVTGAGYVCYLDSSYQAAMLSTSNDAYGNLVAIPLAAFADDDYGWMQVKGPCGAIRVAASAAANVRLNSTATAGQIDDDGTTGAMEIRGIALTTANGGAAATAPGMLNYPVIGATL
jgi:hypothetical protein